MESLLDCIHVIQQAYPALIITTTEPIDHGQNNIVLKINGQFVFRFPKYDAGLQALKRETSLLKYVHNRVSLTTPYPKFSQLTTLNRSFMGCSYIPGEPLWKQVLIEQTSETQTTLAEQLGTFLRTLHQIPITAELSNLLPQADTASQWNTIFQQIRSKLFPRMRPDAQTSVIDHFEAFLSQPQHFMYTSVLKHGDFGAGNILFDSSTGLLSGIIDFGNTSLGDPAYDFAGLLSSYGSNFVRYAAHSYPNFDHMWPRIKFYRGTFALLEALFGLENSDRAAYTNGMTDYV